MAKKSSKKKKHVIRKIIFLLLLLLVIFVALCFITPSEAEMSLTGASGEVIGLEIPALVPGEQVIEHTGYTLSYNEEAEQASWVAWCLTKDEVMSAVVERDDNFREDRSVRTGSATLDDYRGSGYDRGHMAPAADFRWSAEAMSDSFYLSNMSPQVGALNRGFWASLEGMVRQMAVDNEMVYVVTGPVLTDGPYETIGENEVAIPKQYYKVVLDYTEPEVKAIGFVVPNEDCDDDVTHYVRSIDEVEELTGLDFYPLLPDDVETVVEAEVDTSLWSFREYSSSAVSEDYTPTVSTGAGTGAKLQNTFNEVFYELKSTIFSALGITELARALDLM